MIAKTMTYEICRTHHNRVVLGNMDTIEQAQEQLDELLSDDRPEPFMYYIVQNNDGYKKEIGRCLFNRPLIGLRGNKPLTQSQINILRDEYHGRTGISPELYHEVREAIKKMPEDKRNQLAQEGIKYISSLAVNRLMD